MLATVLITNYNFARWLPSAVDSALAQTHPEVQVVVVDDGSTDGSRDVLHAYGDRITTVLKTNGGQGSAVNAGFGVSRGDIICLLDSDDVFVPDKVSRVVAGCKPGTSILHHPLQLIGADDRPIGKPTPRCAVGGDLRSAVTREGGFWPWPSSTGLSFPRTFLEQVLPVPDLPADRYPEAHRPGGVPFVFADAYLAGLAPYFGAVVGLPEVLAKQRLHGHNTWTRAGITGVDDREVLRRRRERYEMELRVVADSLRRNGTPVELSAEDHYRVHQYRWAAGDGGSLPAVLWRASCCRTLPWQMKWRELARLVLRRW